MDSHQLRDILNKIESEKSITLTQITTDAGVDRTYVSKIINADEPQVVGAKLIRKFKAAFPSYFKDNKNNERGNKEVGTGTGLIGAVSSDLTGLILKSYLSTLAARHRAAAVEIEAILQAISADDLSESDKSKESLRAVHRILSDIEGKKGKEHKPKEKGKLKP
ncbi:MAG: hypothetical protein ACTHMM_05650 [Agriterribacter sp.]